MFFEDFAAPVFEDWFDFHAQLSPQEVARNIRVFAPWLPHAILFGALAAGMGAAVWKASLGGWSQGEEKERDDEDRVG